MDKDRLKLYFIAVVPPAQICEEVTVLKEYIAENFKSKHALKSPPHITLHMPFKWKEENEGQLEKVLENFSAGQGVFEAELRNFSAFPKRVIYIDLVKNKNLEDLFYGLTKVVRKELKLDNESYKGQGFTPHMTIAHRDLKPAAFTQAWPEFRERAFEKKFLIDSICLMKHNGRSWDIYRKFGFYKAF